MEVQVRLEVSASPTLEALLSRMLAGMAVTPIAPAVSDSEAFPVAGELDREGTPFDPAAHTGLKTTKGAWRKKRSTAAEVAAEFEAANAHVNAYALNQIELAGPPAGTDFVALAMAEDHRRVLEALVSETTEKLAAETTETVSKPDTDDLDSLDEPAPVKITMDEHVRPKLRELLAKGESKLGKDQGKVLCRQILKANGSVDGTIGGLKEEAFAAVYAQLGAKLEELSK